MITEPICVAPTGDVCGEAVMWHEAHASVYWTNINRFLIHRFNILDQTVRSWFFDEPVTSLTLTNRDDILAVVLGSSVILWEPATGGRHRELFKLDTWPRVRLNDARADPRGSLWVGSMRNNVEADGSAKEAGVPTGYFTVWTQTDEQLHIAAASASLMLWLGAPTGSISISATLWPTRFGGSITYKTGNIGNEISFLTGFSRGSPDEVPP